MRFPLSDAVYSREIAPNYDARTLFLVNDVNASYYYLQRPVPKTVTERKKEEATVSYPMTPGLHLWSLVKATHSIGAG